MSQPFVIIGSCIAQDPQALVVFWFARQKQAKDTASLPSSHLKVRQIDKGCKFLYETRWNHGVNYEDENFALNFFLISKQVSPIKILELLCT